MVYLLLAILMNVGIFLCFRLFMVYKVPTLQAIVINYAVCVGTGLIFLGGPQAVDNLDFYRPWVLPAVVLGLIFIGTFYMMALTTQKFSMTVASIASKISLVIPVVISLFVLGIRSKPFDLWNYAGIVLAIMAIVLSSVRRGPFRTEPTAGVFYMLLPFIVFIMGGFIDTAINVINHRYLDESESGIFPVFIFSSAAFFGFLMLVIRREIPEMKSFWGGLGLGVVNYFSIYFLIKGLSSFNNDGAMVYPLLNMGTILGASMISIFYFREQLLKVNKIGLGLAIISLILLSYQEVFRFLNG